MGGIAASIGESSKPRKREKPLPVTYSMLSSNALGQKIIEDYHLAADLSCQLLRPSPGSNDTYLVKTGCADYVAQVYGSHWRTFSQISYEMDLLAHLTSRGVSVSLPVSGKDGVLVRPVSAPEGPRYLVLFARPPGKPLSWADRDQCIQAGKVTAAIHRATDDFVSEHDRFCLDLDYLIDAPLAAIRPFLAHRRQDWRYIAQLASKLRERALAAMKGGLDWGVCHGDIGNHRNIYVRDDRLPSVVDFDLAGPGWRAYDLVAAQWLSSYDHLSHVWEAFVHGYGQTRPLDPAELAAVGTFHGISRLWTIGLDARNARRWGTLPMSDSYLDSHLQSLRTWELNFGGEA
jgi:Ser/Thr protein kinase RdoA (MazF antagonist)